MKDECALNMQQEFVEKKSLAGPKRAERLTQKAYLNALASVLDNGARIAVALVITPILVSGLGNLLFGVWQILNRLVSQISAADGRPTQALKWVIANRQVSDDDDQKKREVGSAFAVWIIFLPVLLIAGAIVIWFSPTVTKVSPELYSVVRFSCAVLVINFIFLGLIALPEAVLRGMNLGYKRMGVMASLTIFGGVLTAGAIYFELGLTGVAGAQVVVSIITSIVFWLLVRKFVPWFGVALPQFSEVRRFLKLSIWYTLWTLINKLLLVSDVIVLGIVSSALTVTTYTLTGYPAMVIAEFIFVAIEAIIPGLGGVIGQKQYEKAAEIRKEMMTISWLLVTAVGATILMWNRSFIHLWVGSEHYAGLWVNILIVLVVVQWVFFRIDAFVIDLTLNLRRKVIIGAIAAILSIGTAAVLIPSMGIAGLCVGLLGGRFVLTISYPLIVNSFLKRSGGMQLTPFLRPALVTCILFVSSGYLSQQIGVDNWFEWIAFAGISFGLILCTGFFWGFTHEQRMQLIGRLKSVQLLSRNVS
jgi:O-antigen/teichoic acid export membrane protein